MGLDPKVVKKEEEAKAAEAKVETAAPAPAPAKEGKSGKPAHVE